VTGDFPCCEGNGTKVTHNREQRVAVLVVLVRRVPLPLDVARAAVDDDPGLDADPGRRRRGGAVWWQLRLVLHCGFKAGRVKGWIRNGRVCEASVRVSMVYR